MTRPFASALEPVLKQPVVVETKAGAGGQVGAQVAASAKPDGYTLLSHNNGISGYAEVDKLFGRQPKTTRADFIPLARLMADPVLLLVNEQQPYKTLKDFVDDAKKRPEADHLQFGRPLWRDPSAGGAARKGYRRPENAPSADQWRRAGDHRPARQQRANEHADRLPATLQHIKAGKLRPLASFGGTRSKALPDVPTLKELGYDVEYYLWVGIFAPKGTPANVVSTLNGAINKAASSDQFKTAITNVGQEPAYLDAAGFREVLGG